MARRSRRKEDRQTEAIAKGVVGIAMMVVAVAYINPAFRATLVALAKWAFVLLAMATAVWWWRRSTAKVAHPSSQSGRTEPSLRHTSADQPGIEPNMLPLTPLDKVWLGRHAVAAIAKMPIPNSEPRRSPPTELTLALLHEIEWKRFEELCAAYFSAVGFDALTQSHGADGGIDIRLTFKGQPDQVTSIVQCKAWSTPVGVKPVRELLGVMTATKAPRGTFVSLNGFHTHAEALARTNRIFPMDGKALLEGMLKRSPEEQTRLLRVATEGEYWKPTCPSCGIRMVERQSKTDGSKFWGCANYPRCRRTLQPRNSNSQSIVN